jgi:hypothetical protein
MNLNERIRSFADLGSILKNVIQENEETNGYNLNNLIENQYKSNPWFTPGNVRYAINAIAKELTQDNLEKWTGSYPALNNGTAPLKAGIIMAGNIPLVGFHDFLSVLISGNSLVAKTSSKDSELIVAIAEILCAINPGFKKLSLLKVRFKILMLSLQQVAITARDTLNTISPNILK